MADFLMKNLDCQRLSSIKSNEKKGQNVLDYAINTAVKEL